MARYQSISYTSGSVSAASSLAVNTASLPNYFNIISTIVTPNSAGGSFDFKIFKKDTLLAADLLAHWDNATAIYDPMDNSSGSPAIAEEGSPIPYEDEDATNELHVQITNNDSVSHTYTVTILYEEVPLFSSAGNVTFRGTLQATTITATTAFRGPDGSAGTPTFSFTGDPDNGMYLSAANTLAFSTTGTIGLAVGSSGSAVFANGFTLDIANGDVKLVRDAANVLALKNGTTAQEFRVYGTTTGPGYLSLRHDGSNSIVDANATGSLYLQVGGTSMWHLDSGAAYSFTPMADNTRDLGRSNLRVRSGYFGTSISVGTTPATAGAIRLANTGDIQWMNAAGSANLVGIRINGTNNLELGNSATITKVWVNPNGGDMDFQIQSDTNANAFVMDAGLNGGVGGVSFGRGVAEGVPFQVGASMAITAVANSLFSRVALHGYTAAVTIPTGTAPSVSSLYIEEPNITAIGTATVAASVYIANAPTEGGTNAALYVASGQSIFAAGSAAIPGIGFVGATTTGLSLVSSNIVLSRAGVAKATFDNDGIALSSSAGYLSIAGDAILTRDAAANRIAQKNGTTAQEFRVYGTTTGPVYSFFGNDGTNGYVGATGDNRFDLYTATTAKWAIGTAANSSSFYPVGGDNSYDLGLSGTRVRSGYFGTSISMGTSPATTGSIRLASGGNIVVGATNVSVFEATTTLIELNPSGNDVDLKWRSDTNANSYYHDAGAFTGVGAHAFGTAARTDAYFAIDHPARTSTANDNAFRALIYKTAALTVPTGTAPVAASLALYEPNLTATGTITVASTLYVADAPTEGGTNAALYVASGASYFGGNILPLTDNTYTFGDATHRATTLYSLAYDSGNSTMQLKTNGTVWLAATTSQAATFTGTLGVNGVLTVSSNTGIGTSTFGTSANMVLGIGNGTAPTTQPADIIQIYSKDISAGNATLGLGTERAVAVDASVVSTHSIDIYINGAVYGVLLIAR